MHRKATQFLLILTLIAGALACNMPYLNQTPAGTPAPTDSGFQVPTLASGSGQPTEVQAAATEPVLAGTPAAQPPPPAGGTGAGSRITIASTEELSRSGLFDALIGSFRETSGYDVVVELGGSGRAFKLGEKYVADVLLVNNPGNIIEFIAQGHGKERYRILYTDYVILGPENDPAGIKNASSAADAFKKIAAAEAKFVTRGAESELVSLENKIWKAAGVSPAGGWYASATNNETKAGGPGMLKLAFDFKAYTLMDRLTYLENRDKYPLEILFEGDPELFNIYYAVTVNPERSDKVNYAAAQAFVQYLASPQVQELIANFGADRFGRPIFFAGGGELEQ